MKFFLLCTFKNMFRMNRIRIFVALLILNLMYMSLAAAESKPVPLSNQVVTNDGDMKNVLIWQWLNELTADNAAVVLTTAGELSKISLPRSWRKGQTVGQVMRAAEIFLGRFRVHFEGKTLTLISLTADEMMTNRAYTEISKVRKWDDEKNHDTIRSMLEIYSGVMMTGDTYNSAQTLLSFGVGYSFVFVDTWLAGFFRLECGFGNPQYSQLDFDVQKANMHAGVRWLPFNGWFVSPYLQVGLLYSVYTENGKYWDTSDQDMEDRFWGGLGMAGSIGLRIGSPSSLSLFFEYGMSITYLSYGSIELGELRFGLMVGL